MFASIYPASRTAYGRSNSGGGRSKSGGRRACRKAPNPKKCRRRRRGSRTN